MKKILFLLLMCASGMAQTYQNPTFGTVTTKTAPVSLLDPYVTTMSATGVQGKVTPENIPLTISPPPTNYDPLTANLQGHFKGIDQALGNIVTTTAGVFNRIWFTGDQTTITAGTFYLSNLTGRGSVASASPTPLVNADDTKQYFAQDIIGNAFPSVAIFPAGVYAGQLSVRISPNVAKQRYTVEAYKCDNGGTPIASGITGAPIGDLGVTVVAILDSGEINLSDGNITGLTVSGNLESELTINTGERIRYHVSAAKVGTPGGNITMEVFYGSNHNSYYDVPVTFDTSGITNVSNVAGSTTTDALNNLYSYTVTETLGTFANLQALVTANPIGTTINLKPNTIYTQQDALILKDGNTINGNGATLKRDVQQTTTTTVSANQLSTSITVSSVPIGWKIGDYLQLYTDNTINTSTLKYEAIIQSIVGNVITFTTALRPATGTTYTWAIGTTVRKVYSQITAERLNDLYTVQTAFTVRNLTIDGNRTNNTGNYYWGVNMSVAISGRSKLEKCNFINMPNENVMGHGFSIINCYAKDLNGSFIHQSADYTLGENVLGGEVSGNTVINTNTQFLASGHSEGVITFSFTSGRIKIHDNRFLGGAKSVLGNIYYSNNSTDGSNKDLFFHDNYCEGFSLIVNNFGYSAVGLVANVDNVYISDNIFSNCGTNDWGGYLSTINNFGVIKVTRNALSNGTTLINVPLKMQELDIITPISTGYIPRKGASGLLENSALYNATTKLGLNNTSPVASFGIGAQTSLIETIGIGLGATDASIEFLGSQFGSGYALKVYQKDTRTLSIAGRANSLTWVNHIDFPDTGGIRVANLSGTGTRTVVADASGNLSATTAQPLRYKALISQSGTSAPTVVVLENTIGNIVWTRSGLGSYAGTLTGAFVANKTYFSVKTGDIVTGYGTNVEVYQNTTSPNVAQIFTVKGASNADDVLIKAPILIEVYP